jgi:DNA-binding response OmpR family regulator
MNDNKVLVVEDERDTRYILEKLLTKNSYSTATTVNGEEAITLLDEFKPNVILADWTMPVMDGIELCRYVKKNEKYKLIYFIMLTARASIKDRVTGLDVGADDFLVKPVENQELLARIRSGLRINKLQNELKLIEHNKAVLELACTIGHKINNPLSSLIFSLNSIEEELDAPMKKKLIEELSVVKKSIENIKELSNSLVNLANPNLIDYSSGQQMIDLDNPDA